MQLSKIVILASLIASIGVNAYAEEKDGEEAQTFDLEKVTCWEVITLPEEDRNFTLVLLYGYNAGNQNQSVQLSA